MTGALRFLLNGQSVDVSGVDPTTTLLEWLRYEKGLTGTKEGCAEGDCGACTVLVGDLAGETLRWRAVNACILFLPMLDGRAVVTVEHLSHAGTLHPVQQAMVDLHGSQCGFCTPGFVMSLYGRSIGAEGTADTEPKDVIAGNLCRCTGYGPILAAAEATPVAAPLDPATLHALQALQRTEPLAYNHAGKAWYAPRTAGELAALYLEHPSAQIVAGATDVGLWVTKQQRDVPVVISLGEVSDLRRLTETGAGLQIGAGVRYTEAHAALKRLHPDLGELVRRIGATQVRNSGTLGGNIANGSPIGDMPPALIALGATLTLRRGDQRRTLNLEDYFLAYGKQDRQESEFVESLFVPRPETGDIVRIVKLSKRFDSDISAVCGAFVLRLEAGVIVQARVAFGGMAATPKRAQACEASLTGAPWSQATLETAALALGQDFTPLSDARGSSVYRMDSAANLLRRLWWEQQGARGSVLEAQGVDV